MTVRTRVTPIDRSFSLALAADLDPRQGSRIFAEFAGEEIERATKENRQILGRDVKRRVFVDGREGAPLQTVKAIGGAIVATFDLMDAAVVWITEELDRISPTLSGDYSRSHVVFADGTAVDDMERLPAAREYVIASNLRYARKLDPKDGLPARSKQAPRGVYAAIAAVARSRFASGSRIAFTFRDVPLADGGSQRNPAIVVKAD